MRIYFRTNLDEAKPFISYDMGSKWNHVPAVGSQIRFEISRSVGNFVLEVVQTTYTSDGQEVEVELHIPKVPGWSVAEWSERLRKRIRGY